VKFIAAVKSPKITGYIGYFDFLFYVTEDAELDPVNRIINCEECENELRQINQNFSNFEAGIGWIIKYFCLLSFHEEEYESQSHS
jgi:hypothetical protein